MSRLTYILQTVCYKFPELHQFQCDLRYQTVHENRKRSIITFDAI